MTNANADERPTTPDVPPAPGAEVDDERLHSTAASTGADDPAPSRHAERSGGDPAGAERQEATSPVLEHLEDTLGKARAAADQALAPQRDQPL